MIEIGPAETDELDAIADLWVMLAREQHEYGSHLAAEDNWGAIRNALARCMIGEGLVVARDAEVVGFVMFTIPGGKYEQTVTRGIVHNIYVRPEFRDDGIGSGLLEAAERSLAERGADVVGLEMMAKNEDARRFYERNGYASHRIELEKRVESDTHSKEQR